MDKNELNKLIEAEITKDDLNPEGKKHFSYILSKGGKSDESLPTTISLLDLIANKFGLNMLPTRFSQKSALFTKGSDTYGIEVRKYKDKYSYKFFKIDNAGTPKSTDTTDEFSRKVQNFIDSNVLYKSGWFFELKQTV